MATRAGSARTNIYALVDGGGVVQNIVVWNGIDTFSPAGLTPTQALDDVKLADAFSVDTFTSTVDSR